MNILLLLLVLAVDAPNYLAANNETRDAFVYQRVKISPSSRCSSMVDDRFAFILPYQTRHTTP
jgi:hypothetical protein